MRTSVGKVGWRLVTLLGAVSTAAAITACGDGSGDKRLSTEDFVAKGNAICAEANEKIEALGEFPVSPDEAADYLNQFAEVFDQEVEGFSALTPPEDLEETVDQAVTLLKEVSGIAREASETAAAGDMAALREIAPEIAALEQELDTLAVNAGLDECN